MACVFLIFSVVTNLGCGEIKFFYLNGLIKMLTEFRCVEPIPLLFWYEIGMVLFMVNMLR